MTTAKRDPRYGLADEAGKINISKAAFDVLKQLFEVTGQTTSQTASDIAGSVLDWVDEDSDPRESGAEDGYYQGLTQGLRVQERGISDTGRIAVSQGNDAGDF